VECLTYVQVLAGIGDVGVIDPVHAVGNIIVEDVIMDNINIIKSNMYLIPSIKMIINITKLPLSPL
jgi:hypothetical protein